MTDPKDYLRQVVDSTVKGDPDAADQALKDYIIPKSAEVLNRPPEDIDVPEPPSDDSDDADDATTE